MNEMISMNKEIVGCRGPYTSLWFNGKW